MFKPLGPTNIEYMKEQAILYIRRNILLPPSIRHPTFYPLYLSTTSPNPDTSSKWLYYAGLVAVIGAGFTTGPESRHGANTVSTTSPYLYFSNSYLRFRHKYVDHGRFLFPPRYLPCMHNPVQSAYGEYVWLLQFR